MHTCSKNLNANSSLISVTTHILICCKKSGVAKLSFRPHLHVNKTTSHMTSGEETNNSLPAKDNFGYAEVGP